TETEMQAIRRMAESIAEFNPACTAATRYGLTFSPEATMELLNMPEEQRVELTGWMARPGNYDSIAHPLMCLSPEKQVEKIREYAKREDVRGSLRDGNTDEYLKHSSPAMARREGRRR
ncbi:MAG: hypothetical protein ACHQLQ_05135, partial [Candidatus Acidiferrales bacterium]